MKRLIVGVVALAGLLGACSADKGDFREAAEKYIRDELGEGASAECQEPAATTVGTVFSCTGTASDGAVTAYNTTITKKDEVQLSSTDVGPPTEAAPTTTAAGG